MAGKRGKSGSWAGGKAPAQGSAGQKETDTSGVAGQFHGQIDTDSCCDQAGADHKSGFAPGFKRP